MKQTTIAETQRPARHLGSVPIHGADEDAETTDRAVARRAALRNRHAEHLTRLMEQRRDLRGVHALADFVDDAVRWTA